MEVALRRERTAKSTSGSQVEPGRDRRLTKLTDDLLTLARSDADQSVLERDGYNSTACGEACEHVAPLAESAGVSLTYDRRPHRS